MELVLKSGKPAEHYVFWLQSAPRTFAQTEGQFRVGFRFGEKVHQGRVLGEHGNMIGHETGSSLAGVDTTTETSLVNNFKHGWNMTWQHFLLGGFSGGWVSWATSNSWTRHLASRDFQLEAFFLSFFLSCFFIVSTRRTVASNNLVCGWNSWPIDALPRSRNRCYSNVRTRAHSLVLGNRRSPSWWGKCISIENLLLSIRCYVLLMITSLDVMYCGFPSAYKTILPIKLETLQLMWASC